MNTLAVPPPFLQDTALINILFLCHGNICRSPVAEILFNREAQELGIDDRAHATSAALSAEAVGLGIYQPMRRLLLAEGFEDPCHISRQATRDDIGKADLVVVMDQENIELFKRRFDDFGLDKVRLLLSYADGDEIDDPWYTREFDRALHEILMGVRALARKIADGGRL